MNTWNNILIAGFILMQDVMDEVVELPPPELDGTAGTGAWGDIYTAVAGLMISIGAIVALLAAIKIYNNWQTGVDNVFHACMNLLLGSIVLLLLGAAIAAYF